MKRLTVAEASENKGCSRQAVHDAIRKGLLDAERFGRMGYLLKCNKKYDDWFPNPNMQRSGYSRWGRKTKKAKKARRSK